MGRKWREVVVLGSVALEPLALVLQDPSSKTRYQAAQTMGWMGNKEAIEVLVKTMKTEDWRLLTSIVRALDELEWQPGRGSDRAYHFVVHEKWTEAAKLGAVAVKPLVFALGKSYSSTPRALIQALVDLGPDTVEPLIKVLKEGKQEEARKGAAEALGLMGGISTI